MAQEMPQQSTQQEHSTAELVREALEETRALVRLELALAREELRSELSRAKVGAVTLGAAAAAGVCALSLLLVSIAAAFAVEWLAALVLGGIMLALSAALAVGGWKSVPKQALPETRERIESDLKQIEERTA